MSDQATKPKPPLLLTFEEVRDALRPMGRNQVYQAFRAGQIPGAKRIGGRWYAIRHKFNREYRGKQA
jgi:hypothetical protein